MATRRPFFKRRCCKSIGFCLWPSSTCIWSLKLKFQSKLDLHSGNHATYKVQKPKKSNMTTRRPFCKWRCWKSIDSYPYILVFCCWSLKLIFKAKVKLESGNQKIQYGCQAAILKVTSLKINRLLSMATIYMHIKFEIEIPKQTWLMLRKQCRLQTGGRMDGQTDGQGESSVPPYNFVGRGYNKWKCTVGLTVKTLGYSYLHIVERVKDIFDAMCYSTVGPYPI